MKKFAILFISIALMTACNKDSNDCKDTNKDCSLILCFVSNYTLEFRLVDRITGADLVFGTNPRYTSSDIVLYSDPAHSNVISLAADANQKLFRTMDGRPEMYLVVAGTDSYTLNASYRKMDCCEFRVKDLRINNQGICTCCNDVISVPVD